LAPYGVVDAQAVRTNIVMLDLAKSTVDAKAFAGQAREAGVLVSVLGPELCRLITHLDLTDDDVDRSAVALAAILRG
jgi:threonine aldolase